MTFSTRLIVELHIFPIFFLRLTTACVCRERGTVRANECIGPAVSVLFIIGKLHGWVGLEILRLENECSKVLILADNCLQPCYQCEH
jgi:hypothetical protein